MAAYKMLPDMPDNDGMEVCLNYLVKISGCVNRRLTCTGNRFGVRLLESLYYEIPLCFVVIVSGDCLPEKVFAGAYSKRFDTVLEKCGLVYDSERMWTNAVSMAERR